MRKLACLTMLLVAVMFLLTSCDQAPAAKTDETWIKVGHVDDGTGGATVYKKIEPNGKTVYLAIGVNSCSLQIVDTK